MRKTKKKMKMTMRMRKRSSSVKNWMRTKRKILSGMNLIVKTEKIVRNARSWTENSTAGLLNQTAGD